MALNDLRNTTGPERAAILLLALGEDHGRTIWEMLDDEEIRTISTVMSQLGIVDAKLVENLLQEFVTRFGGTNVTGDFERTERLLARLLPKDRAELIMEEIRGPAGRNIWQKISNVPDQVLSSYLKQEHPQTAAVVLSKIQSSQAARVIELLPHDLAIDIVNRVLIMENVPKDALNRIEHTLRTEFISNLSASTRRDSHERMAEVFNAFDRQTEARIMTALEAINENSAERIRSLMFVFDDLTVLQPAHMRILIGKCPTDLVAKALKGASESVRSAFFDNMSTRAAKMVRDEIQAMGPQRLRDVDEAQQQLLKITQDLANEGAIIITKGGTENEMLI